MTRYLMKGMAVMAMVSFFASCNREYDVYQPTNEEKIANAEAVLGVKIDPNQDWNMTANGVASITVNGDYGETYTVKVYSNDPLVDRLGYVLVRGTVKNGETFQKSFEYPEVENILVVSITDSKGFTSYKRGFIEDGVLSVTFGQPVAATRSVTRSAESPSVPHITIPDNAYAKSFLEGATEANYNNARNNSDGSHWEISNNIYSIDYNNPQDVDDKDHVLGQGNYQNLSWEERIAWALENRPTWVYWQKDENYVSKFKITTTYNDDIPVMGSRSVSVYVSGTWNLPQGWDEGSTKQVIANEGLVIVVDSGGVLNIPQYSQLNLQNQARIVVMPGGTITGEGTMLVTNGNAEGLEGYNGGSIDIGTFNNNYGKFYNYGTFKCTNLAGGAGLSNFYNHGVAHIVRSGEANYESGGNFNTANTRIYNACQWYCEQDMRAYIVEATQGSYFYVGGMLMMSNGNDGTTTDSYVALASGALVQVGALWNNNCSWIGPSDGYAVAEFGRIVYMNWTGDTPITQGYFINKIAISVANTVGGNGKGSSGYLALFNYVSNGLGSQADGKPGNAIVGNGGTIFVDKGTANVSIPASEGFQAGVKGCTPGYNGTPQTNDPEMTVITTTPSVWCYAFEDTPMGDYDMNDVVIKVRTNADDSTMLDVTLCCAGASFDLRVYLDENCIFGSREVHQALGQASGSLINTGRDSDVDFAVATIKKPANFSFATADFWVDSPAVPGGVHIAKQGEDPHGVVIPDDWAWPKEFVSIKEAYPVFVNFAEDASTTDPGIKAWYKTPVEGKVYHINK